MVHPNYKPPRVTGGDLRTWVIFYKYQPNDGPEPGEEKKETLYECYAEINEVWSKDLEQAKANDTLSDVTLSIRDPLGQYYPSRKDYLEVDLPEYAGKHYNIKHSQPDPQKRDFIKVIAGLVSD